MQLYSMTVLIDKIKFLLRTCHYFFPRPSDKSGELGHKHIATIHMRIVMFAALTGFMCQLMPSVAFAEIGSHLWPQNKVHSFIRQASYPLSEIKSDITSDSSNSFRTNSAPSSRRPPLGQTMAPASGKNAAYIAFDQGQYLTAKRIAEKLADQNDPQAHTLLGRMYAEGLGVPHDEMVAAKWYRKGAELGDIEAMFAFGVILAAGKVVKKNPEGAAQLFERAARKGHAFAHYNLAQLFLSGKGKPENAYRAAQHLEYAAKKGIPQAQYDLATLYQQGHGVKPNAYTAAYWLRQAADKGMPTAQFEYAVTLLRGNGLNEDKPKIIDYLTTAAKAGVAGAQNRLANIYKTGIPGTQRNLLLAVKWRFLAKQNGIKDDKFDAEITKYPEKLRRDAEIAAQNQQAQSVVGLGAL